MGLNFTWIESSGSWEKEIQEKATEVNLAALCTPLDAGCRQRELELTTYARHTNSELIVLYSIVPLHILTMVVIM